MPTQTKISSIVMPEHYVRGKINGKNVSDLMDVVVKAHGHLFKEGKSADWHELIGKKLSWPFHTPIEIAKNPPPEKGKGKKKGKVFKAFELIDGGHRLTVWKRLKQKELPSIIKDIKDPSERFRQQYETNSTHGLRLDKNQRDEYVRVAHTIYKKSLAVLAKETGLHRASIIRIMADKQRKIGPRAKPKKGDFESSTPISDMTVQGFVERLQILVNSFPTLKEQLKQFLSDNLTSSGKSKVASLISHIREIASAFETHLVTVQGK